MADCAEDSEDATSSLGDEERVRRLFQACDGDGDGFIDSHDLLNVCRELNLEDSIEELMRELGADEQGRISYQEFLRRRLALRPEIEALKNSRPQQPEYLPTSSENSLGEGKMSWEFDSGARDLSPEPHSLQQLVASAPHPASGNLLDLANKLHVAALASLKSEILDLSNRLQCATQERDHFEKSLHKAEVERHKAEQKLEEEMQLHEEQLTELHSVIAELTRKAQHQRSLVIREEEDVSEADEIEISAGVECSQTLPLDEEVNEIDPTLGTSTSSNENEDPEEVEEPEEENEGKDEESSDLEVQLTQVKAENALLQEQLNRALQDLETISKLNSSKKQTRDLSNSLEVVRVARVSSPSRLVDRTSPSLVTEKLPSPTNRPERNVPVPKIAERVRLKKVENHVTGSDIATFGVCHTKVAEHLVSDMQEESDLQELSRGDVFSRKQHELETERLNGRLEHVRAQNTVLALTLEECKAQCDRLSLLVGKYESNALALQLALNCSDQALDLAEALVCLLETDLGLVLSNCRGSSNNSEDNRFARKAAENRRKAERHARELLEKHEDNGGNKHGDWTPADESKLREQINRLKSERNTVKSTVVDLETPHVQPFSNVMTVSEARKLDLETAVLMQELMSMREDKAELRAKVHLLEKERSSQELRVAAQNAHLQALLQSVHHLQVQINEERGDSENIDSYQKDRRLKEKMEELVGTLDKVTKSSELRYQQNAELVLDLRAANTALVSTLDRCKKKYQGRLKKLETQMLSLVERHNQQVRTLKQRITVLEEQNKIRTESTH